MLISLGDRRRVADMLLLDLVQNLKTVCIAEKNIVQGKAMISYCTLAMGGLVRSILYFIFIKEPY
ncbi:MAG TPA: hypothetical protein VF233_07370 [Nitrososphaeraceae archaeon]